MIITTPSPQTEATKDHLQPRGPHARFSLNQAHSGPMCSLRNQGLLRFMNLLKSHQIQWPSEAGTGGKHLPTGFACQNHSKHFNINILSQKPVETHPSMAKLEPKQPEPSKSSFPSSTICAKKSRSCFSLSV